MANGKKFYIFKQYTYALHNPIKGGNRWRCSSHYGRGCKAYIMVSTTGDLMKSGGGHIHESPKLHRTASGYIRL